MEMSNFEIKISKLSNRLILGMHVGNGSEAKLHHGNPVNNGEMELKFNFTRKCFSMLRNIFLTSFSFYLNGLTW